MTTPRPDPSSKEPRQALENSERAASEKQPGSFKDEAMDDKVVSIPAVGPDEKPIRGLDPK